MSQRSILEPLIGLMRGQPQDLIESITIAEIKEHRRLLDAATSADAMRKEGGSDQDDRASEQAYLSAMIALYAQQAALSTLLDILGHIPNVPNDPLN